MLIIHSEGQTEPLQYYKDLTIRERVNGEHSLSFLLLGNDDNYNLVSEESIIEYDNQQYRIKKTDERSKGKKTIKSVACQHIFFDLIDHYKYETLSGTLTISQVFQFITSGTEYTYSIIDPFNSFEFDEFGDDNGVALVQEALNVYGAEIELNNKHINVKQQIGRQTDFQFRYKYNLKAISKEIDSSNISTYIKGFGAEGIEVDYTSPLESTYGIRHAEPYKDAKITSESELLEIIKKRLNDEPKLSIKIEFADLKKAGFEYDTIYKGDSVFLFYEPMNVEFSNVRIIEIERYPESLRSTQVTLANFTDNLAGIMAKFSQTDKYVRGIRDGTEKISYNALDGAIQRATEAVNNSLTELEYPVNMGIVARDKVDPNRYLAITSSGLGITTDNGVTFKEAVTADGFVLSAGAIGQLEANNVRVGENVLLQENLITVVEDVEGVVHTRINFGEYDINKYGISIPNANGESVVELGNFLADQYGLRVTHTDGTYTQLTDEGLKRYVSDEGYSYQYETHLQEDTTISPTGYGTNKRTLYGDPVPTYYTDGKYIQLPDRFKGKNFKAFIVYRGGEMAHVGSTSSSSPIMKINSIDYTNAIVHVIGYNTSYWYREYDDSTFYSYLDENVSFIDSGAVRKTTGFDFTIIVTL